MIGMIFMLLCVIGLGLGSTKNLNHPQAEEGITAVFYGLLAVVSGLVCPIIFSIGGLTVRYCTTNYKFEPVDMSILNYFLVNIAFLIMMIFTYMYGSHVLIFSEIFEMTTAGFIGAFGGVFLNLAVTSGLAGPAFALANIQVVFQTLMDAFILGDVPTVIEVVSASLGVLGCCIIALGPEVQKMSKRWFRTD